MLGQDLVQRLAPSEQLADRAVAAVGAHARRHQVAHPRQAGEGLRLGAHGDARRVSSARPRVITAGPGVVANAQALADAGGDGDDVLQGPADLAPDHVVVAVHPEQLVTQH